MTRAGCVVVFFWGGGGGVVLVFFFFFWLLLLLPAFTRLGHERQDLLSLCDEMHVCTD